ncbi:hypothetical protein CYLTODRAFT_155562 [Cylindrobasidium torrendii FP15055 ss-10]|uniref:C2H2-type domain-containing protein n=1 Tax=Cylindrobasidium torrendii FP15055 ss-10 TaxID=1314674 RepID=A0A0D7BTW2_9AGAR|nr:hypothetical protein CYLTODRAFT_155562 [Cylindrobasidium torrendii FP15055 ss-10]
MSHNGQIWKGGAMQFTSVEEAANVVHLAEQAFLNTIHEKRRVAYDGWQAAQEMVKMDKDPVARTALRVNLQTTVLPTEAQGYQALRRDLMVRVKAGWDASCNMMKLQGHPKLQQADQAGLQRDAELHRLYEELKKTQEQNVQPAAPPSAPPTPVDTLVSPAIQGGPQTPTTRQPQHPLSQPTVAQSHHTQSHTIHNPAPTLHYDTFSLNAALPADPSFTRVDSLFDPEVTLPIIDKMRRDSSMHAEAYNGYSFTKFPNGEIVVRDHYHSREYTVIAPLRSTQTTSSSRTSGSTTANQAGPSGLNRAIPSSVPTPVASSVQQSTSYRPHVPTKQASRTPPAQSSFTSLSTSNHPPPPRHFPTATSMAQAGPSNPDRASNPAHQQEFGKGQSRPQSANPQPPRPLSQPAAPPTQPQYVPPVQVSVSPAQNVSARSRDDAGQSISAPPPSSKQGKQALPRPSSLSVAPRKGTLAQDLLRALLPKRARSEDDTSGPVAKVQVVERDGRPEALPALKVNDSHPTEVQSQLATTGQVADRAEPRPASASAVNSAGTSTSNSLAPTVPPGYRPFNQTTIYSDPSVQAAVAVNLRPPPELSPLSTAQFVQVTEPSLPANAVASSSRVTTDTFIPEQPGHPNDSNLPSRSVSVQEAPLFLPSSPRSSIVSVEKVPSESSDSEDEPSGGGKEVNAVGGAGREFAGRVLKQVFVEMPRPPDWVHTHLQRMREEAEVEKSLFVSMNMTNGDDGEEDALREAMTRLRRSSCCWTDCNAVLNCPERLRRHLLLHDGTRQQGSEVSVNRNLKWDGVLTWHRDGNADGRAATKNSKDRWMNSISIWPVTHFSRYSVHSRVAKRDPRRLENTSTISASRTGAMGLN